MKRQNPDIQKTENAEIRMGFYYLKSRFWTEKDDTNSLGYRPFLSIRILDTHCIAQISTCRHRMSGTINSHPSVGLRA